MKTLKLLSIPVALFCIAGVSCKDNDHNTPDYKNGQIRFEVTAPMTTRAQGGIETTTASIDNFLLNAYTDGKKYINDLTVTKSGSDWAYGNPIYWPATPVNFYAVSPKDFAGATQVAGNSFQFTYVNSGKTDALYSVAANQKQSAPTDPDPVSLNFRHALAQVLVNLKSTNEQIKVQVNSVTLKNFNTSGTFEFPKQTTAQDDPSVVGTWSKLATPADGLLFTTTNPVKLTDNYQKFQSEGYAFVIPQALKDLSVGPNKADGNFIEIVCTIYSSNDTQLWPNDQTVAINKVDNTKGIIRIPALQASTIQWNAGVFYVYNIDIKDVPGLEQVKFTVTVDDYNFNGNNIETGK